MQGVGFRAFVEKRARGLGLHGWARNEDDGRVQVYAVGKRASLDRLAALLHQGPPLALVRTVEQQEADVQQLNSFHTE